MWTAQFSSLRWNILLGQRTMHSSRMSAWWPAPACGPPTYTRQGRLASRARLLRDILLSPRLPG
eukprot:7511077-Lingulodinium_polyedra.AAC.1